MTTINYTLTDDGYTLDIRESPDERFSITMNTGSPDSEVWMTVLKSDFIEFLETTLKKMKA